MNRPPPPRQPPARRLALAAVALALLTAPAGGSLAPADRYPYRSEAFTSLVADSYREVPSRGMLPFHRWLEGAYASTPAARLQGGNALGLEATLGERRRALAALSDPARRAGLETETAAWLHRMVKATIPRFSLERGFEFVNAVRLGERQCLLQSVLVASLLQAVGVEAGAVMVWKNEEGRETNNGHVVTLVRLASARDLLVDASNRTPFARHRGLFLRDAAAGSYRFVEPRYAGDGTILGYRPNAGGELPPTSARPLDLGFVRSQFYYYRGERAPGGFLGRPATPAGLAASARFLELAVRANPENPLAVYVLGHVYRRQGRAEAARAQYLAGHALYQRFGFVPSGPRAAYAEATRKRPPG